MKWIYVHISTNSIDVMLFASAKFCTIYIDGCISCTAALFSAWTNLFYECVGTLDECTQLFPCAVCECECGTVVLSTTATTSFQHKHHSHNSLNSLALYRIRMNNFGKIQLIKYNSTRKAITTELLKLSTVSFHYARVCMLLYHLLIQPKSCIIFNVDVCLFDHTQTHSLVVWLNSL